MQQLPLASPALAEANLVSRQPGGETVKVAFAGRNAIAGAAGGVTSVLLGQPFDLIKVRLQTSNSSDVLKVAKDIWTHEGPLAFYKGAAIPFLGVGVCVSIQFVTFHSVRQAFERLNSQRADHRLSFTQNYLAGGAAGLANSLISGPVEHIRTRLQLQPYGAGRIYAGPLDCVRKIIAQAGFAGLYKAYPVAVAREFQAYGFYFATFEAGLRGLAEWKGKERKDMSLKETIPCGALAGIAFWISSYPIDVIKSKLQADGFGPTARYRSTWAAVSETWQHGGMIGFWRGLSSSLVRTSLSSAGCFAVVEQVRKWT